MRLTFALCLLLTLSAPAVRADIIIEPDDVPKVAPTDVPAPPPTPTEPAPAPAPTTEPAPPAPGPDLGAATWLAPGLVALGLVGLLVLCVTIVRRRGSKNRGAP